MTDIQRGEEKENLNETSLQTEYLTEQKGQKGAHYLSLWSVNENGQEKQGVHLVYEPL
jgi:hypothetical protein